MLCQVLHQSLIFPGRYDLSMPDLSCEICTGTWSAGVDDLIKSNYWPATPQFCTVYDTDIFFSFEPPKPPMNNY